jgi:hypothetical protein
MNSSTLTTLICAVYKKDPDRYDLLKGHMKNLDLQTTTVNRVYVFEDNDQPPEWLTGECIVLSRPCTIYEAWNLALSTVRTPYVMNLNLDDRLNIDAVERMQESLTQEPEKKIVCGDWLISFTQKGADQVSRCTESAPIPSVATWPPERSTVTIKLPAASRVGGTLGPATMWRSELIIDFPRYPYRTTAGSLLPVEGDRAFWTAVMLGYGKDSVLRLPIVIGNYYSHPNEQAEFRGKKDPREIRLDFWKIDEVAIY